MTYRLANPLRVIPSIGPHSSHNPFHMHKSNEKASTTAASINMNQELEKRRNITTILLDLTHIRDSVLISYFEKMCQMKLAVLIHTYA